MSPAPVIERIGTQLRFMGRSLVHRNFRLFFIGQSISMIGTWMQSVAIGWFVWRITRNPNMSGVIQFCAQVPVLLLGPTAGFVADRFNRRRLLLLTQTLMMFQAFALAALVYSNVEKIWPVIALTAALGAMMAFDLPLRQSFYIHMVDRREDLNNAIALNSIIINGSRAFGPALSGVLLWLGSNAEGHCFLLNGISFIAALWALLSMRNLPKQTIDHGDSFFGGISEGFRYAVKSKPIRSLLMFMALSSFAGVPYVTLLPMYADHVLGDTKGALFGLLMAVGGIGALGGAFFLASRRGVAGLDRAVVRAMFLFSAGIILLSISRWKWLSVIAMLCIGGGMIAQFATTNTIIQTIVSDRHRGRIMSFFTMSFMGVAPFGGLLAGFIARYIGAPKTLFLCGSVCLAASIVFAVYLPKLHLLAGATETPDTPVVTTAS